MFSELLQELRKDRGWKQSDLADKLNMSKSGIGSYELGKAEPSFENLIKIFDLFHVNIDYLLGHTRDRTSWDDIATEIPLETGAVPLQTINETLRSLNVHDRTLIVELLLKLASLQKLETK